MTENMVRVELGGESREVPRSKWTEAADELVAKFPDAGAPKVTALGADPVPDLRTRAERRPPEAYETPVFPTPAGPAVRREGTPDFSLGVSFTRRAPSPGLRLAGSGPLEAVDAGKRDMIGTMRATVDAEAAEAAGFAVAPSLFDRGLRVEDTGIAVAKRSRQEWEHMPTVHENCANLMAQIGREEREDSVAMIRASRMLPDGTIGMVHVDDAPGTPASRYVLTDNAFASLVTRAQIPGGGRYLRGCWAELRAHNVNEWIGRLEAAERRAEEAARVAAKAVEYAPLDMRVRHRLVSRPRPELVGAREAFAIVGPSYPDLDADKIAEAIALATNPEARGRVTYDGKRTRWEILFHTNVQPKHFVSGEFMRAGVIVTTDDTGGGAIIGNACVRQSLCLNVLIVRTTETAQFSIRHVGDVSALAKKFRDGFGKAMGAIDHFLRAWDFAVEDDAVATVTRVAAAAGRSLPARPDEIMAGIFRDLLERELVPVRAKTEDAVRGLMRAWNHDTSAAAGPTRAAVANAFTRYAHEGAALDPWAEDEIQAGAGMLLRRTKKDDGWATSLGFLAPEDVT